ncbi:MAG: type II toxin-antitoxin system PemK/MazF family toxin [Neisseriaceae bacterium]
MVDYVRGDIVISSIGGINGKPRPFIVVQNDLLNSNLFTTLVAPLTSEIKIEQEDFRPILKPSKMNTLERASQVMLDRIIVINKRDIVNIIGNLTKKELQFLNQSLAFVIGF